MLRIEDTDRERSTPENVEQILDALRWLNLDWDEGPIFQTERAERHAEVVEQLLEVGHAYRSTATAEDRKAYKERHGSDRGFRGRARGIRRTVGCAVPDEGETVVQDVIRGRSRFPNANMDDFVIARADGSALYKFADAVDDLDAAITHVVRGEDHLSNTPKQLLVFDALGFEAPIYAHLPLLHGPDGKKLSKRHGAASVQELRDAGYLPEAVDNYIALLGAGFAADEEHFSLDELARALPARARVEEPGGVRRAEAPPHGRDVAARAADRRADQAARAVHRARPGCASAVEISREKIQTLADFWPLVGLLLRRPGRTIRPRSRRRSAATVAPRTCAPRGMRSPASSRSTPRTIEPALRGVVERLGEKPGKVFQPVRVAIAGTHGVTRDLRERRAARARRGAGPHRRGSAIGSRPDFCKLR